MVSPAFNHATLVQSYRDRLSSEDADIDVARRLYRLRLQRGISLAGLAQAGGLRKSQLQKIEDGRSSPTVAVLQSLLAAMEVDFNDFFAMRDSSICSDRRTLTPADQGRQRNLQIYRHRIISSEILHKKMLPIISTLSGAAEMHDDNWTAHPGEAFVLVLRGRVKVLSEEYGPLILEPGDSTYFDCNQRFMLCSGQQDPAEVFWLTSLS